MKFQQRLPISLIIPLAAVASIAVSCKPSAETSTAQPAKIVDQKIDKVQKAANEATKEMTAYTYAQKKEFVAAMEKQLADLNRSLDELDASLAKAGPAIKVEAKARLETLRTQTDLISNQLDSVKDANASTWDSVQASTSKAYDELSESFQQARQWLSEKISPDPEA